MTGDAIVIQGDALHLPLADESVNLIFTSPPYFALRSYRDGGEHYDGQRLARWRIFESGHHAKAVARTWTDRQGALL